MITQENFKKYTKLGLIGLTALVVAPVIFMVIQGIVGLAIAGVVGGLVIALAPAASQFFTTLKFKALKGVISHAPVEALQQRALERREDLNNQREILRKQTAALEEFRGKALQFMNQYPEEAASWQEKLTGYEQLFSMRMEMWKAAKASTEKFEIKVDKAEDIYQMAVAMQELDASFGKKYDFMADFKEQTAFDAIDKENSLAMADLKMALLDDDFVTKKVEQSLTPIRQVSYTQANTINLGNLLESVPVAERIR